MTTPLDPPPPDAPAETATQRQLARLYGESLFGAWQDPVDAVAAGQVRRRGRWGKRLAVVLLLGLLGGGGVWLYQHGLARRAQHERAQVAKDVATFLADGELDRLAQFLALLLPAGQPLHASDPYLDLIVSAEAALFRYHDATPARLGRIEHYLSLAKEKPARLLAHLTVASRPERAYDHEALVGLADAFAKDPGYHTLMATMLEQRGEAKAARASWERSAQAGPLWLPHRYQQCAFEARQRNREAVGRLLAHMTKVAPDSAWTRLAHQHFGSTPPTATAAAPPAPVARYHAELATAFARLGDKDLASARQALGRAFAAVNAQAPFVLDAFAALLDAKADNLAMEMTSYEAWPRGNAWAEAKLAELQTATAARTAASEPAATATTTTTTDVEPAAKPAKSKNKSKAKQKGKAKPRSRRRP